MTEAGSLSLYLLIQMGMVKEVVVFEHMYFTMVMKWKKSQGERCSHTWNQQ